MKKLKFVVLVLIASLVSSYSFANNESVSKYNYAQLASNLEREAKHLMQALKAKVSRSHQVYRQVHRLYHAAQSFSKQCHHAIRQHEANLKGQLEREFVALAIPLNKLMASIQRSQRFSHSSRVRRNIRRVESKYYLLKNAIARLENQSNARNYNLDDVDE